MQAPPPLFSFSSQGPLSCITSLNNYDVVSGRLVPCLILSVATDTVVFPEPRRIILPLDHTIDIERIYEGEEEVTLLFVPWSHNLRHAIPGEVDLCAYQQALAITAYGVGVGGGGEGRKKKFIIL